MENKYDSFWDNLKVQDFWKKFDELIKPLSKDDQEELTEMAIEFHVWIQDKMMEVY